MLLTFFMDGVKYSKFKDCMPFLSSLNSKPLMSEFGYSCCCHATMYSGLYPEEHGTWFIWKRGENSPYKWVNKVPLLKYFNLIPVKYLVSRFTRKFLAKNTSYSGIPMLVNLPLKYWGEFEPSENVFWTDERYLDSKPTLFKILKEKSISHKIVGLNKKPEIFDDLKDFELKEKNFYYFFVGETDNYLHSYGEDSVELKSYLKKVDETIEEIYLKAKEIDNDVTLMVYSDHGHIGIKQNVNLHKIFSSNGLKLNKYIHLVESTFVRFWFRSEQEKNQVIPLMKKLEQEGLGFEIDEKVKERWHLNFSDNSNGDFVFHLNAPAMFTNTIWGYGHSTVSAHGYYPELYDHLGLFVSNKPLKQTEFVRLTDILPTQLECLGLDSKNMHGHNVLGK